MIKDQKALELTGSHERPRLDILLDGGPLCIAPAWDWNESYVRRDLFRIYHKRIGIPIGPCYTTITLADQGMKKAIKLGKHHWENDAHWLAEAKWLHKWIDEQLGKPGDLVGGSWAPDPEA
jgi:hypothetical protein